ncbi:MULTISPECIES: glutathione peroxidase [Stenotrophomonas]|uniref:glutathione peroxidase n=1 Tax=Stenotrophomonas TaxID=40323 RepID=UPI0007F8D2A2|nr:MULTISPECIES: glutathione peroxidase [Stenotrophomonas maltophilia group]MCF3469710.1 glutathione peroxidase [Stenotrophomonas maltophilia]MCF3493614.1 glutathione peroxidase [Stenotrophomonas maltophilia]MCF3513922.1 glutathione peroxidase [Stenotrophomonas maltophilia]MCU1039597.1 glutathione peroxidase [Stenotrophomonas maltophilia]MCU1056178.1 glutathione peroxidase [Stenotrophomonas maltophilia]
MTSAYDFSFRDLDGQPQALARYQGHPLLLVNVASRCGFTPQYTGLEQLWQDYRERGLVVIGFPCNQFGAQEPGGAAQIRQFCSLDYPVSFPLSEKIEVNGEGADPLWAWMTHEKRGLLGSARIKWNFSKFLVDRQGQVVSRHAPTTRPEQLRSAIEALL